MNGGGHRDKDKYKNKSRYTYNIQEYIVNVPIPNSIANCQKEKTPLYVSAKHNSKNKSSNRKIRNQAVRLSPGPQVDSSITISTGPVSKNPK